QYRPLTHVVGAGIDPDGVVHDAVHDRISMDPGTESLMPVLLRVLSTEHRRSTVIATLEQLQQHAAHRLIRMIKQPLIDDQQREGGVLTEELRRSLRLVLRDRPRLFKIGHADVVSSDSVLTSLLRQRAPQIGLSGTGEALEHHVLLTLDERTRAQLGKDMAIQPAFLNSIHAA